MIRLMILSITALFFTVANAEIITPEKVIAGAEKLYAERLADMQSRFELDNDSTMLTRVRGIASKLIAQAKKDHPKSATYQWEIHITDDPEESASCMAGGKILVGENYVKKMVLNDTELAMLLSHEIQHAVSEHNFKEFQEALRLDPARNGESFLELEDAIDHDATLIAELRELNRAQENEADREGLMMAWRAGWPPLALANYFKKLARADSMANVDHDDHPASARRWQAMRELADTLIRSSRIQP